MCSACKSDSEFRASHPGARTTRRKEELQRQIIDKMLQKEPPVRPSAEWSYEIQRIESMPGSEENIEVRKEVAQVIKQAIEDNYEPTRIWVQDSRSGPNGGTSTQVTVALEDDEGKVRALAINVYCGGSIMGYVDDLLEEDRASAQLKADLGWA